MKNLLPLCLALSTTLTLGAQDTTYVTFAVDMNGVEEFDRDVDVLRLAGNFQNWMPMVPDDSNVMTDPDSNGVFSITVPIDSVGFQYKYVVNNWDGTGEGNTNELFQEETGDCVSDPDPDGNVNRVGVIDLAMDSVALPVYLYNSCEVSQLQIVSSTRNLPALTGVGLAPNPMADYALVSLPSLAGETFLVRVFGADGRQVAAPRTTTAATLRIDRADLPRGLYLVDVTATQVGRRSVLRLIVE